MSVSYQELLAELVQRDPRLVVLTAENRAAIRELPARLGPRFIDVGICEQTLVGMAAGLALRGRVPVVHALASFLVLRAYEFIRTDVGIGALPVKLVGYVPGVLSTANGPTHQAVEDIALLRSIPGMQIFCPADREELLAGLPALLASPQPGYLRFCELPAAVEHRQPFVLGRAEVLAEGDEITLLSYGPLLGQAAEAQRLLAGEGRRVGLINVSSLEPLDETTLLAVAARSALLVVIEDHFARGGLYTLLAELLLRAGRSARVLAISLDQRWFRPAALAAVLEHEGFSAPRIAERVRAAWSAQLAPASPPPDDQPLRPAGAPLPCIEQSERLYARALALIPSVTQTLAKGPTQYVAGVAPKYLRRGRGCRVWDVDGNGYLDLTMALGPLVLGYCDPVVDAAIREQLADGITFSLMHPLEVEVAELVRELVPQVEMVRFSKTGADVTSAALRLARAHTGRTKVLSCGYHGWHDWSIASTPRHGGIPEAVRRLSRSFAYNDLPALAAAIDDDTACVILEPTAFEAPRPGFLAGLRELCDQRGVVLVFDEMWTGFRVALGGAQARYGVRADLVTFSKAVANGMPLAVLAGRAELLRRCDADVFFYTTFGGEALSLAAARATLQALRARDVPAVLEQRGLRLQQGYNALAARLGLDYTTCVGLPCRSLVSFDARAGDPLLLKSYVQQELIRCGVLWSGCHNLCWAHGEAEIDALLEAYARVLPGLDALVGRGGNVLRDALHGEPVRPVFQRGGERGLRPPSREDAR